MLVAGYEQAYASTASSYPNVWAHRAAITPLPQTAGNTNAVVQVRQIQQQMTQLMRHQAHRRQMRFVHLTKHGVITQPQTKTAGFTQPLEVAQGPVYLSSGSADESAMSIDLDPYRHGKRILIEQRYSTGGA